MPQGTSRKRRSANRQDFQVIAEEMQLVLPSRTTTGHVTKRNPQHMRRFRAAARKRLDRKDRKEQEATETEQPDQRKRGVMPAMEGSFLDQSLMIRDAEALASEAAADSSETYPEQSDLESESSEEEASGSDSDYSESGMGDDGDADGSDDDLGDDVDDEDSHIDEAQAVDGEEEVDADVLMAEDLEDEDGGNDDESDVQPDEVLAQGDELAETDDADKAGKSSRPKPQRKPAKPQKHMNKKQRRRMFRMRNFQALRHSKRHGEALAAHARGDHVAAIKMLMEVAKDVPSAPQIYSSLGTVYEDMLNLVRSQASEDGIEETQNNATSENHFIGDSILSKQMDLARKAYGAHHVAAVLCKKDFALWVRAGSAALEIVSLHEEAIAHSDSTKQLREHHRVERKQWLAEALSDLEAADKLNPPGIDVATKLAATHMEAGSFANALTILVDLKEKKATPTMGQDGSRRNEFLSSHGCLRLFSDLMLRIGYECRQWNDGKQSHSNPAVRRWLRKFSTSFDWQERRLQALSLAFEAAAGSVVTNRYMAWVRSRVSGTSQQTSLQERGVNESAPESRASTLDRERDILQRRQKQEVESFDAASSQMRGALDTEAGNKDRKASREAMLLRHLSELEAVEKEFTPTEKSATDDQDQQLLENYVLSAEAQPLPLVASARTVTSIVSELMRQLLSQSLFEGCQRAAEALASYYKARIHLWDKKVARNRRAAENYERLSSVIMAPSLSDDEASVSDDEYPCLSDDEDLDRCDDASLMESLRRGLLPPEIRFLYGLSLFGVGGKNYLAFQCASAVQLLEQEPDNWLEYDESQRSPNPVWTVFKGAMIDPIGRTQGFALIADVLHGAQLDNPWSHKIATLFQDQIQVLNQLSYLEGASMISKKSSSCRIFRKDQVVKICIAHARFSLLSWGLPSGSETVSSGVVQTCSSRGLDLLRSLVAYFPLMWYVDDDGSLTEMAQQLLRLCHDTVGFILASSDCEACVVAEVVSLLTSKLTGVKIPATTAANAKVAAAHWLLRELPISSTWQDQSHRALSRLVYNLCVSCNVKGFSGWEKAPFSSDLLRKRRHCLPMQIGISTHDGRVAGVLPLEVEKEVSNQWRQLSEVVESPPPFDIDEYLKETKEQTWYKEKLDIVLSQPSMAQYEEPTGLALLLQFSRSCLLAAVETPSEGAEQFYVRCSLSILLPLSQFLVDETLWYSEFGGGEKPLIPAKKKPKRAAVPAPPRTTVKPVTRNQATQPKPKPAPPPEPEPDPRIELENRINAWAQGRIRGNSALDSFVGIPVGHLNRVWKEAEDVPLDESESDSGKELMSSLHKLMEGLRGCYTEAAAEKLCLQIAAKLIEIAEQPSCFNPFLCLQQAALYASQGQKLGNNDEHFRYTMPLEQQCTPLQALVILGRADCFQLIGFPSEAIFLCNFVAHMCRLRRDPEKAALQWNDQWMLVCITASNVSAMIRQSANSGLFGRLEISWTAEVMEELENGRKDGEALKKRLGPTAEMNLADIQSDDEEVADGENDAESMQVDNDVDYGKATELGKDVDHEGGTTGPSARDDNGMIEQPLMLATMNLPVEPLEPIPVAQVPEYESTEVVAV